MYKYSYRTFASPLELCKPKFIKLTKLVIYAARAAGMLIYCDFMKSNKWNVNVFHCMGVEK